MNRNTWPGGRRHAMEHEAWNRKHYPGTLQLCSLCEEPTGRCEEDAMFNDDGEPLCEECWRNHENVLAQKAL